MEEAQLDFSEALLLLKQGKKVARRIWASDLSVNWAMEIAQPVLADGRPMRPQIVCASAGGLMIVFTGGSWDLLADDWEVVD